MKLARMATLLLAGCIIHTDEDPFAFDDDLSEASVWVNPERVEPGMAELTLQDGMNDVDFREVREIRAVGDFEILEWSATEDRLSLVIDLWSIAEGKQIIALDFEQGSLYPSFKAK